MTKNKYFLQREVTVRIDRLLGSCHPSWGFVYELNYGYVPHTISGDGEELDAYIIGVDAPLKTFTGICIAIIQRLEEDDDKLIVVPQETILALGKSSDKIHTNQKTGAIKYGHQTNYCHCFRQCWHRRST